MLQICLLMLFGENKIVAKISEFTVYKLDRQKCNIQINEPINPLLLTPLKYHVYENIMENGAFALFGANAPFSIIFSKVFKTELKFFLKFLNVV